MGELAIGGLTLHCEDGEVTAVRRTGCRKVRCLDAHISRALRVALPS